MTSALHNHDEYSLLDGFSKPREYLERAKELNLKAFATTNHGNQYSWVYYDKLKADFSDIKILYGVEMYECFDINVKDPKNKYFHLIVIAKDEKGRIILNRLVTKSNFKGFYYRPRIDLKSFIGYGKHLIVSSACLACKLSKERDYKRCIEYIFEYKNIFPYFYLEMQSHKSKEQVLYNKKILELSKDTNTPFIITMDSHAALKKELYYQGRHVQIAQDEETISESYEDCYLQSDEEIHRIMDEQIGKENVALALENTDKIADLCDIVNMPFQNPQLPTFPLPNGFKDNHNYLRYLCDNGWKKRYSHIKNDKFLDIRRKRLDYELSTIYEMNYDGYFLIVWDFINWGYENGIYFDAGRGSGAGSIVCYLLNITDLDPITYDLIFERFLNRERISLPDIDVDLNDRDKVIRYLISKYSENNVCQIINFSYITPVIAIKDVGRVLKLPYSFIDKLSKYFSYDTFEECIKNNPNLYDKYKLKSDETFNERLKELFDIAGHLSGKLRQVSIHAGGVGIVDKSIDNYMGMKLGSNNEHVIQVDKRMVEEIGIIKFDLLGLKTLNLIKEIKEDTNVDTWKFNINNPEFLEDKKIYELICGCKTNGIFQIESIGMKDLIKRLQPGNIEELCALIALYRPDSIQFIDDYIKNKFNDTNIRYIHEDMIPILEKTYACMIYQEQLIEIVKKFGNRSYGKADKFRKGISKKDRNLVKQEAEKLYKEIIANGYDKEIAYKISNDLSSKGNYFFNKSHSMAYAVLCLQTAFFKTYYPVEFYKALLNINRNDNGILNKYIVDAQEFNVEICPPDINRSKADFSIYNNKILFGFEAINGIGKNFSKVIIDERKEYGPFKNMKDFLKRLHPNDAQVVFLIKAGTFSIDKKKALLEYVNITFDNKPYVYRWKKSLPTLLELKLKWEIDIDVIKDKEERVKIYNEKREINEEKEYYIRQKERFKSHKSNFIEKYMEDEEMWEFQALSIFINNNPFKEIYQYIISFDKIKDEEKCVIVGVISKIVKKKDKNKNQYAFVTMYSAIGNIEITCWSSKYNRFQDMLKKDAKLAILCCKKDGKAYLSDLKTYTKWLEDTRRKYCK